MLAHVNSLGSEVEDSHGISCRCPTTTCIVSLMTINRWGGASLLIGAASMTASGCVKYLDDFTPNELPSEASVAQHKSRLDQAYPDVPEEERTAGASVLENNRTHIVVRASSTPVVSFNSLSPDATFEEMRRATNPAKIWVYPAYGVCSQATAYEVRSDGQVIKGSILVEDQGLFLRRLNGVVKLVNTGANPGFAIVTTESLPQIDYFVFARYFNQPGQLYLELRYGNFPGQSVDSELQFFLVGDGDVETELPGPNTAGLKIEYDCGQEVAVRVRAPSPVPGGPGASIRNLLDINVVNQLGQTISGGPIVKEFIISNTPN